MLAAYNRELTAQHIGMAQGKLFPMALTEGELHADVKVHEPKFVPADGAVPRGDTGKLSMGVGGINSLRRLGFGFLAANRIVVWNKCPALAGLGGGPPEGGHYSNCEKRSLVVHLTRC